MKYIIQIASNHRENLVVGCPKTKLILID